MKSKQGAFNDCGGQGKYRFIEFGNFYCSAVLPAQPTFAFPPVIIEVIEPNYASAKDKIDQLVKSTFPKKVPVAIVIGLNARIGDPKNKNSGDDASQTLQKLTIVCGELTAYMASQGVAGGCFPIAWNPTSKGGGYTFPFLECRSLMTLHPGVAELHEIMSQFGPVVVRGMDSDVRRDPLLTAFCSHRKLFSQKETVNELQRVLLNISSGETSVVSGGYEWDIDDVTPEKLLKAGAIQQGDANSSDDLVKCLKSIIAIVNIQELAVRTQLLELSHRIVYWPEPNVYMGLDLRKSGAGAALEQAWSLKPGDAQQKESTHYAKQEIAKKGMYSLALSTRKPLKTYFDEFLIYFTAVFHQPATASVEEIKKQLVKLRQTHLDIEKVKDIMKWHGAYDHSLFGNASVIVDAFLTDCAKAIYSLFVPTSHRRPYRTRASRESDKALIKELFS